MYLQEGKTTNYTLKCNYVSVHERVVNMLLEKTSYVIDGRKLQLDIEISMDMMKFHYERWLKQEEEVDYRYYRINKSILMQALSYQGCTTEEILMIIDYALDAI